MLDEAEVKRIIQLTIKELRQQELMQDVEIAAYKEISDRLTKYFALDPQDDELADALIQNHCGACANKEFCAEEYCPHYEIRRRIEAAPTIEAEPVRHAHWESWGYIFHGIEWKRCSACGMCADVSYYGLLEGKIQMSTPAICGCCGADMREGGADNG